MLRIGRGYGRIQALCKATFSCILFGWQSGGDGGAFYLCIRIIRVESIIGTLDRSCLAGKGDARTTFGSIEAIVIALGVEQRDGVVRFPIYGISGSD